MRSLSMRAGADVVDQDAVAADFVGEALGERHHAHARGARERQVGDGLIHRAGQDVDDAAAALCRFRWGRASRDMRAKNSSERCTAVAHCSSVAL